MDHLKLSWSSHSTNFKTVLKDLHQVESLSDVTLVCDDGTEIMAHKFVLIGSSPVFKSMLYQSNQRDKTVVFLRGVSKFELECVLQFMYLGQTQVPPIKLQSFMDLAKDLKMKGLYDEDDIKSQGSTEEKIVDETESILIHLDKSSTVKENSSFEKDTSSLHEEVSTDNSHSFNRIQEEVDDLNFKCTECNYSSANKNSLRHHIEKNHEGLRYPCAVCNHQAASLSNLYDHQAVKHKINPKFRCKICDYCTNHTRHKRQHAERKHPESMDQEIFEIKYTRGLTN